MGIGQTIDVRILAEGLGIPYPELSLNYKKGHVRGIKRCYLETKAFDFANNKEWESCIDCLGLLVFGVILFPQTLDYIDLASISVFWGAEVFNTDPTITLLADVIMHFTLGMKRGGVL